MKRYLIPKVSPNDWSYIVNEKGNAIRMTTVGSGSCSSIKELQDMIDGLSEKELSKLSDECDSRKQIID